MRVLLLGPVEVSTGSEVVRITARKERAVLCALAVRPGKGVSASELTDYLWGDDPPPSSKKALQTYVSSLRRVLPEGLIETTGSGYVLRAGAEDVDSTLFERWLSEARQAMDDGELDVAEERLRAGLELWRGPPFDEAFDQQAGVAESARLEELHRSAVEELAQVRLQLGRHELVVADLEAAVAAEPLRERRWALLMLALYRSGRQGDALRRYQQLRGLMCEELGIEPSAQLVALEEAILLQQPELEWQHERAVLSQGDRTRPGEPAKARLAAIQDLIGIETSTVPPRADEEAPLPAGVVTILFSDIEGSTRLLARLGDRFGSVLDAHRRVLRSAWSRWHGHEVNTEGDSFFVVFSDARDALMAAIDGQRGLAAHAWPGDAQVRVRIGLHTGEPLLQEDDYFGMDVHRAARIAGAAHGGQIVLSSETREQIGAQLDSTVQLVDLGRRRLKDLVEPEHLFQAVGEGLQSEFPPLKSLGAATSLPMPPTPLVGRSGERRELEALLQVPDTRLVTLTGAGGSGKTRLAIALAAALVDTFDDGVYFVALSAVTNGEAMWRAIGDALGVASDAPEPAQLVEVLRDRKVLLVLDNLEQLPDAPKVVNEVLAASVRAVVLATSRRPLHLQGEHEHPVPPLDLPYDISMEEAERSGAVQLFVQQARLVRPGFELTLDNVASVAAICRRVDGLPLGIELAAARIKLLSPDALLTRLDRTVGLRARDVDRPTRQQTLHAAISWSYDLLPPDLQRFFRHLGVFAGGADLNALDKITAPGADPLDMVADLVDASLATVSEGPDGEPRIALLQTVSEYALEQLTAADELEAARRLHAEHYAAVAEEQAARLWSGSKQLSARDTLLLDLENITSALSWALQSGAAEADRGALALRLAGSLWHFYGITYRTDEGRRWLDAALAVPGDQDPIVRARALSAAGTLAWRQADYEAATEYHQEALTLQLEMGDVNGAAFSLNNLAVQASDQKDYERAVPLLERARGMTTDPHISALVLLNLAESARGVGDHSRAARLLAECRRLFAELGDEVLLGLATINLAPATLLSGDLPGAVWQYELALALVRKLRDDSLSARYVLTLVALSFATNQPEAAARLYGAALALHERIREVVADHDIHVSAPCLAEVRASLGGEHFTELCQEGSRLSQDQALQEGQRVLGECGVEPVPSAVSPGGVIDLPVGSIDP